MRESHSVPFQFVDGDLLLCSLEQFQKRCLFLLDFAKEVRETLEGVKASSDHPFSGEDVKISDLCWAMSAVSTRAFCLHHGNGKLHDYGFVVESNPYDTVELKYDEGLLDTASMVVGIASPKFSSPAPWQHQLLSQLNLAGKMPDLKVTLGGQEIVEGRLLAAIRILLSSEMVEVEKHDLDTLKSLSSTASLGIANEIATSRTVIAQIFILHCPSWNCQRDCHFPHYYSSLCTCRLCIETFSDKGNGRRGYTEKGVSETAQLSIKYRIQKKSVITGVIEDLRRRV
ncbi:unnamed protein product [Eruca vesicaria subsp. sativa]|uniref:Uncharacterized protein n=1 Tax=Eruca vesicaria subsp. sativa TaxID=29727 RepID=A0ABC8LDI6_ERUVS|nr:unnamed protein product [Eruca vesicaria subsp. sativa]